MNVVEAPAVIDRTLTTNTEQANRQLWDAAGYSSPPTVEEMVAEVADYAFSGRPTAVDLQRG